MKQRRDSGVDRDAKCLGGCSGSSRRVGYGDRGGRRESCGRHGRIRIDAGSVERHYGLGRALEESYGPGLNGGRHGGADRERYRDSEGFIERGRCGDSHTRGVYFGREPSGVDCDCDRVEQAGEGDAAGRIDLEPRRVGDGERCGKRRSVAREHEQTGQAGRRNCAANGVIEAQTGGTREQCRGRRRNDQVDDNGFNRSGRSGGSGDGDRSQIRPYAEPSRIYLYFQRERRRAG